MRLEPKAKPIRIRIKVGNVELSDLSELKKKFYLKDIYPLYEDGRLDRWLRQIGENALADNLSKSKIKESHTSTEDVIHRDVILLSEFFDDVRNALDKYGRDKEWSTDKFLSSASEECIKIIYKSTEDQKGIEWSNLIVGFLTLENVFSYYEDGVLNTLFPDPTKWGEEFARLGNDKKRYRTIFKYLIERSQCEDTFKNFLESARSASFDWESVYRTELQSIDFIERTYKNKVLRDTCNTWGKMFANAASKKNWEPDGPRIEKILGEDKEQLMSFYENTEHKEAKEKTDPWYRLANSIEDYKHVKNALDDYTKDYCLHKNYEKRYNYNELSVPLSKQIIDFLCECEHKSVDPRYYNNNELYDEKIILDWAIEKSLLNSYYHKPNMSKLKTIRDDMTKSPTVRSIATYVMENPDATYAYITKYMAKKIAERLENLRVASKKSLSSDRTIAEKKEKNIEKDKKQLTSLSENTEQKEAKGESDPWYMLANYKDYENVKKALNDYLGSGLYNNYKEAYGYGSLDHLLGKQILDFLHNLKEAKRGNYQWEEQTYQERNDELEYEKAIMKAINKRTKTWVSGAPTYMRNDVYNSLSTIYKSNENPTVQAIAEYALKNYDAEFEVIAKNTVEKIAERLENLRGK